MRFPTIMSINTRHIWVILFSYCEAGWKQTGQWTSETLIACGNVPTKNKSVPLPSSTTRHRNKNTTPNLQWRRYPFFICNCITQWMNYMTSTVLVSKFVQHPSEINVASEHTIVAKCLGDTMDRRTKKTPDKQLVNFFDVRTLVTYYPWRYTNKQQTF